MREEQKRFRDEDHDMRGVTQTTLLESFSPPPENEYISCVDVADGHFGFPSFHPRVGGGKAPKRRLHGAPEEGISSSSLTSYRMHPSPTFTFKRRLMHTQVTLVLLAACTAYASGRCVCEGGGGRRGTIGCRSAELHCDNVFQCPCQDSVR